MLINRIAGATRNLGAPVDWDAARDGPCGALPVRDVILPGRVPAMVSSWQPTPDELARLAAGASIHLRIVGGQHPPVMLEVSDAPDPVAEAEPPTRRR